jgi:UDP-glucose 6-dehydrogenase
VTIVDVNAAAVARTNEGQVPFMERGTQELLQGHIGKNLKASLLVGEQFLVVATKPLA